MQENEVSNFNEILKTYSDVTFNVLSISTNISALSDVISNTENQESLVIVKKIGEKFSETLLS